MTPDGMRPKPVTASKAMASSCPPKTPPEGKGPVGSAPLMSLVPCHQNRVQPPPLRVKSHHTFAGAAIPGAWTQTHLFPPALVAVRAAHEATAEAAVLPSAVGWNVGLSDGSCVGNAVGACDGVSKLAIWPCQ